MRWNPKVVAHFNFGLFCLLLFLFIFSDKLISTAFIQSIGRGHIVLLHLPIGILVLLVFLHFFRFTNDESSKSLKKDVLQIAASFALLTALMGLFLSQEGDYDATLLERHKYLGMAVAVVLYLFSAYGDLLSHKQYSIVLGAVAVILIVGSHFGASLTHGTGYITGPFDKKTGTVAFDENASIYQNSIFPIFKSKCISCHNPSKQKGQLDLSTETSFIKGGENGAIIDNADLNKSRLIEHISLPEEDKLHMPPKGKSQLTELEKELLTHWVVAGAEFKKPWNSYDKNDTLFILADNYNKINKSSSTITYTFPPADQKVITSLIDPYTTINPLAIGSPALRVDFFVRAAYNANKLTELQKLKKQIVELNLGNMPVTDADIKNIIPFSNLQKLVLNNALITDAAITELVKLPALQSLSLSGTPVSKNIFPILAQSKTLKEVFVWNTTIQQNELIKSSAIQYHTGYIVDSTELQRLNAPAVKNSSTILEPDDSIVLNHRIPGVDIRYTTNDSIPDTIQSAIYIHPLKITQQTTIKAKATKQGWLSSSVATFSFFPKGIQPLKAELLTSTNEKYRAEGGSSLIDLNKGDINNLIDGNWLGFRENHMEAIFEFEKNSTISNLVVSINNRVGAHLVMPEYIEVYAGEDPAALKSISKKVFPPLTKGNNPNRNEAVSLSIPNTQSKYIKLKIQNVNKLPNWHPGKGQKGWLFVDEVFFY